MPRQSEKDRVARWQQRITQANKVYDRWEQFFNCARLVNYWLGKQWGGLPEEQAAKKYCINMIFPTIEIKLPSLLFYRPQVKVTPRPGRKDDLDPMALQRAQLSEDAVQTCIDDPNVKFKLRTLLALRDAEFRFGVIEVGYSADWIDNPNAGKPVLKEGTNEPMLDKAGSEIVQPDRLPQTEALYLKRIPPETWRVSPGHNELTDNDWWGYYEWHYLEDVKRNPRYKNTSTLKGSGQIADAAKPGEPTADEDQQKRAGMVKLWKIWDNRKKVRHVLAEGHEKFLIEDEPFTYCSHAVLKYYEIPDEFYPLPPVYNWLGPQDELNETREMQRVHRRRFTRRYVTKRGAIDATEKDKLESGEDGVWAETNVEPVNAILAVPDAPLDPGNTVLQIQQTMLDFQQISGVGGEQRGVSEADTATQANIIDVRTRIRESAGRSTVAEWLGKIAYMLLQTIREKMQLPFWVQTHADPQTNPAGALVAAQKWVEIKSSQMAYPDGGYPDYDVTVEVSSLSPVAEDQSRLAWNQVLALISNPGMALILSMSEPILRKTLAFYGIKSEREIVEIANVMKSVVMMQMAQAAAGAQPNGGTGATATASPDAGMGQPAGLPASGGVAM